METINWLHIRGLALIAFIGLFFIYALLVAFYQNWRANRRARRITEQGSLHAVEPAMPARGGIPVAEPRAWLDAAIVSSRHAA